MSAFLDLFSGIGGFALGAYWAGLRFDNHYFSEVDDYAIRVYQQRFPDAVGLGDIRKIHGADLPQGDWIIAGGFPCQDISVAGKGAGLAGKRSGLWFEYARLIGELRPKYAIMENVGALSFRGLDAVLGSLAEIGYNAEWQDIRASDVGAPHRRERIWIIAYPELRGKNVADPNEIKRERSRRTRDGRAESTDSSETLADSPNGGNVRRDWELATTQRQVREHRGSAGNGRGEWWAAEPDVGRVAYGVPSRVDRLKCLGNAIVPQCAEVIFAQSAFDEWRKEATR